MKGLLFLLKIVLFRPGKAGICWQFWFAAGFQSSKAAGEELDHFYRLVALRGAGSSDPEGPF